MVSPRFCLMQGGLHALYSGAGVSMTGAAIYCGLKFASYDASKARGKNPWVNSLNLETLYFLANILVNSIHKHESVNQFCCVSVPWNTAFGLLLKTLASNCSFVHENPNFLPAIKTAHSQFASGWAMPTKPHGEELCQRYLLPDPAWELSYWLIGQPLWSKKMVLYGFFFVLWFFLIPFLGYCVSISYLVTEKSYLFVLSRMDPQVRYIGRWAEDSQVFWWGRPSCGPLVVTPGTRRFGRVFNSLACCILLASCSPTGNCWHSKVDVETCIDLTFYNLKRLTKISLKIHGYPWSNPLSGTIGQGPNLCLSLWRAVRRPTGRAKIWDCQSAVTRMVTVCNSYLLINIILCEIVVIYAWLVYIILSML